VSVLAASVCPEIDDRLLSFSSDGRAIDTYVWVKQCDAHVEHGDVSLAVNAYAWSALDRDLGAVLVREFVHATVQTQVELSVDARYVAERLEVTVNPRHGTRTTVEPVGNLDLEPSNWLSLLAIELAPSAGISPEALAKRKMREEVGRALASTLSKPLSFAYDARRGKLALADARADGRPSQLRVAPRGTALVGPFPPSSGASVRGRVTSGPAILTRAVCRGHAERLVDADRRGDVVDVHRWVSVAGDGAWTVPAMPCAWMLALRAPGEVAVLENLSLDVRPAQPPVERRDRWVSVDDVSLAKTPAADDVIVVVASDVTSAVLYPHAARALPMLVKLGPDEHLLLRAERGAVLIAEAPVPDDAPGRVDVSIPLAELATVRLRARVQEADE
jgi:hypothetical protein